MTTEEIQAEKRLSNNKTVALTLAQQINEGYRNYTQLTESVVSLAITIENARIRLGTILTEAKEVIGHGKFAQFVEQNCPDISQRSARRFMQYAKAAGFKEIATLDNLKLYHKLLVDLGLKEAPEGHGPQQLHDFNAFSTFTKVIGNARKTITEVFERKPLNQWTQDDKEQLKEQLQPIVDTYYQL